MLDLALQLEPSSVGLIRDENPIQEFISRPVGSCELVKQHTG